MKYNFDLQETEPEPGRSPTPQRDEVEWVQLQNHPVFSSYAAGPVHDSTAAQAPRNLLAWDGASRLYVWDSDKLCLHRISIRLGEPDPTSVITSSASKQQILWNGIDAGGGRRRSKHADSWLEDLVVLSLPLFKRLISAMKSGDLSLEMVETYLIPDAQVQTAGDSGKQSGAFKSCGSPNCF